MMQMKKINTVVKGLVLSMILFSGLQAQVINEWLSYYEPDYGFGIDFPLAPDHSFDTLEVATGHLYTKNVDLIVKENEDYNSEYRVIAAPFPFDLDAKETQDRVSAFFNDYIERFLLPTEACQVISKSGTQVDLMYEMNIKISCSNDNSIRTVSLILVNDYFYMLEVVTNEFKAPNKHITKFLKSFRPFQSHY